MATLLVQFVTAATIIVIAGTFLTYYGDVIGERTGMGRALAGIVLLATATSLPELTVDCNLAHLGDANLPLGDLLGSSLFNLLILAILDLLHRGPTRMLSRTAAAHALSATMSVVMTALCLVFLLTKFKPTIVGIGPGPIVLLLTYALGLRLVYFDQRFAVEQFAAEHQSKLPMQASKLVPYPSLRRAVIGYVAAAAAILLPPPGWPRLRKGWQRQRA